MNQNGIPREKLHEARAWATLIMSVFTTVAIPVGWLVLSNQRMEIEKQTQQLYISKATYDSDRQHNDEDRRDEAKSIGEIQGKLNSLFLEQVRMSDNISLLKDNV